jgi:hypothetical protein
VTPELQEFLDRVAASQPAFGAGEAVCPVDQTKFSLPNQQPGQDNGLGGVATDLMKIALAPSGKAGARYDLTQQQYDRLRGSCPTCGATYMAIDIHNLSSGLVASGASNLKLGWKPESLAPELDASRGDGWTKDEEALAHYLTLRTAGWPAYELGFTALSGAYTANLSAALDRERRLPGAGFYALAAAEFRRSLAIMEQQPGEAQAITLMTLGELQRLLGQTENAASSFAAARAEFARQLAAIPTKSSATSTAQQQADMQAFTMRRNRINDTLTILSQLEGYLKAGDLQLHRADTGQPAPPDGWQLDRLLPAINADLEKHREESAGLTDPQLVVDRLLDELEQPEH